VSEGDACRADVWLWRARFFKTRSAAAKFLEDGHQETPSAEWAEPIDVLLHRQEICALVRASIDRLPESYRTVLVLRDIEEVSTAEAAGLLGITENALKIRLHRARQALRALLDPHLRGAAAA